MKVKDSTGGSPCVILPYGGIQFLVGWRGLHRRVAMNESVLKG